MQKTKKNKENNIGNIISIIIFVLILVVINDNEDLKKIVDLILDETYSISSEAVKYTYDSKSYNLEEIPEYNKKPYIIINNNNPYFEEKDYTLKTFENYSNLDVLGRAGTAYANVSIETMPTEERKSISNVHPSGWQSTEYKFIDGGHLYNRCHLIGFQLTGENANEKNLITCTRYMNTVGMLEYENKVSNYVKETGNHVLYRVTPIYEANNLVASGVEMEGYSVEDNGKGIKFNIYVYNVQDKIQIDYETGKSKLLK